MGHTKERKTDRAKAGTVSFLPFGNHIRFRWRYPLQNGERSGKRDGIVIPLNYHNERDLAIAANKASMIRLDLIDNKVDRTLQKYFSEYPAELRNRKNKRLKAAGDLQSFTVTFTHAKSVSNFQSIFQIPSPYQYRHAVALTAEPGQPAKSIVDPVANIPTPDCLLVRTHVAHIMRLYVKWVHTIRKTPQVKKKSIYHTIWRHLLTFKDLTLSGLADKFVSQHSCGEWKASTLNNYFKVVKPFFEWLDYEKYISKNPFKFIGRATPDSTTPEGSKPFTPDEAIAVLDAVKNDRFTHPKAKFKDSNYYPILCFLLGTGTRNAEGIGLKRQYVDFKNEKIEIKEVLARTPDNHKTAARRIWKAPKNGEARTITLPKALIPIIKDEMNKREGELVFYSPKGFSINDENLGKVLKKVCEGLGLRERTPYVMRHTYATIAIDQNVPATVLAYLLGHRKVDTSIRYYITPRLTNDSKTPEIKLN